MNQETDRVRPVAGTNHPAVTWNQSIRFKLAAGLCGLLLALMATCLGLIWLYGLPLLVEERRVLNRQIGNHLVTALLQQFRQAEVLSRALANLVEALPYDEQLYLRTIPGLLDNQGLHGLIAGGGLWPEPHRFDPKQTRRSFFWGRDSNGQLRYFDNYNDPAGPGYHGEEWYVPVRLQSGRASYWSRSYSDPYSHQPMVTCSTAFFLDGSFAGVASVDLKLEGVNQLLLAHFADQPGYAFVLDRNNKFIAFPDLTLVRSASDFIDASELGLQLPVFQPLADKLAWLNHRDESVANRNSDAVKQLAAHIDAASYQIGPQEARVIAHNITGRNQNGPSVAVEFTLPDDTILRQPVEVTIHQMPHTFWKVVSVFPATETARAASRISRSVTWTSLTGIALWGLVFAVFLWQVLFRRLNAMSRQVVQAAQEDREINLDLASNDELGMLAQWYNHRTRQLHNALLDAEGTTRKLSQENSEHRLTAALLEKSLALQHAILDSANLIIISMDAVGMIMNCNAGTSKLLGFQEEDLIGKIFPHRLIDRLQLQAYQEKWQLQLGQVASGFHLFTIAQDQGRTEENEWIFTRKDGSHCNVLLSVTPVINPSRQLEGWLAVGSDISQRKAAEENLLAATEHAERASRAKTNFLANMSHELRTPLNAVIGFTHRLQKKVGDSLGERNLDALNTIERSANHLMALINDLLDISKIEAGRMELNLSEFDCNRLIEEIHAETRTLAEGRPVHYNRYLPRDTLIIQADRQKLKQILYNLVSNAFKATEQGTVDIRLAGVNSDGWVQVIVSDSGKGMSPEDSRKLFQKFTHLDTYVDGKASTGLGLYLTMKLVKLHHGNISYDSSPGKGTRFTVELPLRQAPHSATEAP